MAQVANGRLDKGTEREHRKNSDRDMKCGFGFCPEGIQRCANLPCFTLSYSMCAFLTQSLSIYISSQITSIEKQFGLSGTQTGFLLSCNEIGFVLSALVLSHLFAKGTIPKYLGLVTIVFGLSGITCSLPHLIFGVDSDWIVGSNSDSESDLCKLQTNVSIIPSENCSGAGSSITNTAIAIIATGMMIQGVAKGPRTALVATYVDNNVEDKARTGIYIGIITAVAVLGPAAAVGLGGVFSGIYVTMEDVDIETTDPKWIGAWWLGFIAFGVIALIVAIPVCLFPKRMPRKWANQNTEDKDVRGVSASGLAVISNEDQKVDIHKGNKEHNIKLVLNDFLKVHKKLATNCIYVLMIFSSAMKMLSFSGMVYHIPKYVEKEFLETAWRANFIVGGLSMVDVFGGTVFGGYLTSRLRLTRMGNLKLILVSSIVSCISIGLAMLVGCDQPVIEDYDRIRNPIGNLVQQNDNIGSVCAVGCSCDVTEFYPVCGENGTNFYSPCYAGCNNRTAEGFTDCLCDGSSGALSPGYCEKGCSQLIVFCILLTIMALSMTIQIVPIYMTIIRSVSEEEKAAAIGINTMLNTLLGWLPGSVLFGLIFDTSCLIWNESCGRRGSCAHYDLVNLRISFFSLSLGASLFSLILLIVAFVKTRQTDCMSLDLREPKSHVIELEVK